MAHNTDCNCDCPFGGIVVDQQYSTVHAGGPCI